MTATKTKVELTNSFHGSTVRVVGELVTTGGDGEMVPDGYAEVRLTADQVKRALRKLCGIKTCLCGRHGPSVQYTSQDGAGTVVGKIV